MRPLDSAQDMDSTIIVITGPDGRQCEAAWLRTLRSTGDYVYSGCYSTRHRPGADRASVHVAFPLEEGNVQVFLRPEIDPDGSLWLRSLGGGFGADGAYVVVNDRGRTFAACPPLREEFHVWVDDEGVLRTDHQLSCGLPPLSAFTIDSTAPRLRFAASEPAAAATHASAAHRRDHAHRGK
jgi:hypothetical protein